VARLDGKIAFITGGARGQGRAIAVRFAHEGADIVICDVPGRRFEGRYPLAAGADLEETAAMVEAAGGRCVAETADVRSQAELDAVVERASKALGPIDVLVANAGVLHEGPFWTLSDEAWSTTIDINLTGAWHSAKAVAPAMIARRRGVMLFTASVMAIDGGLDAAHYVASKAGMVGLMKCVAAELAPYGIRANALMPGGVDTTMSNRDVTGPERDAYLEGTRSWYALPDMTAMPASAVADAAAWLASDEAEYVTGTSLVIDGGRGILPRVNLALRADR